VAKKLEVYDSIPESALVIVAHPDDAEFMVAGTVSRWARGGARIIYLLVTDGDKGSSDHRAVREDIAALRRDEQRAACKILGVRTVEFLHYEDGMVEPTLALRRDITCIIRKHKPQVAMCQDPSRFYSGRGYINHPDHRAVAEAALAAIYPSARDGLTFPELLVEGLPPHKIREVFIGVTDDEDLIVDISDTIALKAQALKAHKSQVGDWEPLDMLSEWAKGAAEGHSFSHGETFRYLKLDNE
jgi:LmbE family N-acetylglucosaminyl deacetylase